MPEISEDELKSLKEKAERAEALEASKQRVENESAKVKARAKEAEDKLALAEKAKLEAEGNTQALLEAERKEKLDLKLRLETSNKKTLKEKLRSEASKHAKDAHDIDMLLKVADHKELLKLDEEALTVDGVKDFVEKCRETHKYLFSTKKVNPGNNKPPGAKDDFDAKTQEEKYLAELKNCTSRKELEDVRKKYNIVVD